MHLEFWLHPHLVFTIIFFDVPSPGTRVQYHALLGRPLLQPPHQFKVGAQSHANVGGRERVFSLLNPVAEWIMIEWIRELTKGFERFTL